MWQDTLPVDERGWRSNAGHPAGLPKLASPPSFGRRAEHANLLGSAFDRGALVLPVYLVGECTTYDIDHGHPSFAGARHDGTFFVVAGEAGTPWPAITCMRSVGVFNKRVEVKQFSDYDHVEIATVELFPHIGYVDMQLSKDGAPSGRIGFGYHNDSPANAHSRAHAVGAAILRCREGKLPSEPID